MTPVLQKKVLIWRTNSSLGATGTNDLTAVYTNLGLTVHDDTTWSGTLDDYQLIHWPRATSDPSWWSSISGGTWVGRLHITAEANVDLSSYVYVNGKSATTGVSMTGANDDPGCGQAGSVETDDMTSGVSVIRYAGTSRVSGGTTLSKTLTGSNPWLARNKPSGIDFIVAGDSNHCTDTCGDANGDNRVLFENMWNVAV